MIFKKHLILIFFVFVHLFSAQRFLNLDFEKTNIENLPLKWKISGKNYLYEIDKNIKFSGEKSIKISSNSPDPKEFASFYLSLDADDYIGKELCLNGNIKVLSETNGNAGLWIRVNDSKGKVVSFDNMSNNRINGNSGWKHASIKMKIADSANIITIGGIFKGEGNAWFDDFKLFVDDKEIKDVSLKRKLSYEEIQTLKKYIYPLKSYDPNYSNNEDLKIFSTLIGNSKVVALGEVTHGSSEIFKMKDRIIRYLAQNDGFDIFSIEAAMPESYKVNNYTLKGEGNPEDYIRGMQFWTWRTQEVLNMIKWMKEYNQTAKQKIIFTGFDLQSFLGAVDELERELRKNNITSQKLEELKQLLIDNKRQREIGENLYFNKKAKEEINEIIVQLKNEISKVHFKNENWLLQNIRIIEQYVDLSTSTRDKYMAENIMWIKNNNSNSKIVLWAHNGHIEETGNSVGKYLSDQIGSDYCSFGFLFYSGKYTAKGDNGLTTYTAQESPLGSYEYYLNSLNVPYFILDLKKMKEDNNDKIRWMIEDLEMRKTGAVNHTNEFFQTNLSRDFDFLIFINESSNSMLFKMYIRFPSYSCNTCYHESIE
jgi:erythromycin esterase